MHCALVALKLHKMCAPYSFNMHQHWREIHPDLPSITMLDLQEETIWPIKENILKDGKQWTQKSKDPGFVLQKEDSQGVENT